jgi:hypothetical protein
VIFVIVVLFGVPFLQRFKEAGEKARFLAASGSDRTVFIVAQRAQVLRAR